jgi:transcriptional regulator with XRE-family HTH domain
MDGMTLSERLSWARRRQQMTQDAVATAVGISQSSYGDLESGRSKTTRHVAALSSVLGVSPMWLERGTGSPDTGLVRETPQTYETAPTARELALLARFRALSSRRQAALLEFIASD